MHGCPRPLLKRPGERGFILLGAIWLLVLAGSISALLMLRSLASATAAAGEADALERDLALEAAIQTVLSEHLFNEIRSPVWQLPARARVIVGGESIAISITSESGRLDVNEANPALIDAAFRGFGLDAARRGRIVGRLLAGRAAGRRIGSFDSLRSLLAPGGADTPCIRDQLTFVSGLSEPRGTQMSFALSRALARGAVRPEAPVRQAPEPGAALRIEASTADGASLTTIARVTGLLEQPVAVSARVPDLPRCTSGG